MYQWQKAKVIEDNVYRHMVGKYIWVKIGPAELVEAHHRDGRVYDAMMVEDNLQPTLPDCDGHGYELGDLELQGGEESFRKKVRKIPSALWTDPAWSGCA